MTYPYETEAARGEPIPENLPLADIQCYTSLRNLYQFYYSGRISKDDAKTDKQKILSEWDKQKRQEEYSLRLSKHTAERTKQVELTVAECRKNPTVENLKKLLAILDGLGYN